MAKQTFTTGQVLTAAQMTSLQQTAMLGGSASAKVASFTLVAADAGTSITMSNASATTITVNTNLFAAGDTVTILNVGAGTCTITAGTATVSKPTNATLALVTSAGGVLYFTATGAATFLPFDVGAAATTPTTSFALINSGGTALTGSGTTTVSFSGYNKIAIVVTAASTVSSNVDVNIRLNTDTSYLYDYYGLNFENNVVSGYGGNFPGAANLWVLGRVGTTATTAVGGIVLIDGANSTNPKFGVVNGYINTSTGGNQATTNNVYTGTSALTSISIVSSSGNFDAGRVYVYGA